MCGVPYHAADGYVAKLIRRGFRVAICDQTEDPSAAKGLVRREIVRIVTPGTATESFIIERESCYLLARPPRTVARRGLPRRLDRRLLRHEYQSTGRSRVSPTTWPASRRARRSFSRDSPDRTMVIGPGCPSR